MPGAPWKQQASRPQQLPLDSRESFADSIANRLALGIAAGLIAVLVHGEAPRLASEELTWRALLGR